MRTYTFPAIIEKETAYGAFFPDLPGCGTAADTIDDLADMAREALTFHLSGMVEDGEAIPEPSAVEDLQPDPEVNQVAVMFVSATPCAANEVTISLSRPLVEKADAAAAAQGRTREGVVAEWIEAAFGELPASHAA